MQWHNRFNNRQMPWKGEKDPYKIWLSEIILQQTRVEQGLAYFEKFISTFPSIHDLAAAPDEKVYKLWEGLGYYSRCANLLITAREIIKTRNGAFPKTFDEVIALKGVGNYTASAIMSFAYNKPYAVVDGNVFRVLSRFFGIKKPIDSTEGKKYFAELSARLIHKKKPALYNQAIMDFGAVICKPALPLCDQCILNTHCIAYQSHIVSLLPVKEKKIKQQKRFFNYVVFTCGKKVLVNFWATWCGPCRSEMPDLQKALGEAGDTVVLGVNKAQELKEIAPFADELRISFPLIANPAGDIAGRYGAQNLPTSYFINSDGTIGLKKTGVMNYTFIKAHLELLK